MKRLSLLVATVFTAFVTLASPAYSRLGDTEKELIARFGLPRTQSKHSIFAQGKFIALGPVLNFKQDDWFISCDLIDGICHRIKYYKTGDWTAEQIKLVLSSNDQGSTWVETSKEMVAKLQRSWKRTDGSTAEWKKGSGMEVVWVAYERAKANAEQRAKADASRKPKI